MGGRGLAARWCCGWRRRWTDFGIRRGGYRVAVASHPAQALELAGEHRGAEPAAHRRAAARHVRLRSGPAAPENLAVLARGVRFGARRQEDQILARQGIVCADVALLSEALSPGAAASARALRARRTARNAAVLTRPREGLAGGARRAGRVGSRPARGVQSAAGEHAQLARPPSKLERERQKVGRVCRPSEVSPGAILHLPAVAVLNQSSAGKRRMSTGAPVSGGRHWVHSRDSGH